MAVRVELRIADVFVPALYVVSDDGEAWISSTWAGLGKAKSQANLEMLRKQADSLASVLGVEVEVR